AKCEDERSSSTTLEDAFVFFTGNSLTRELARREDERSSSTKENGNNFHEIGQARRKEERLG
ncbi:MAG: hypothetical protein Q7K28_01255, partial [Candidatus Wildermuthbacteria bacterium]|nr:hypothetical protein [Candidatus Wildermuthbacteria bacterium]